MRKHALAAFVAATLMLPAFADDRALFVQPAMPEMPAVAGGSAQVDKALAQIVPHPYRVLLEESVPASLTLVWKPGNNWMEVLRGALAPVGLVAQPNWAENSVTVMWRERPPQPAPSTAVSVVQPQMAGSFELAQEPAPKSEPEPDTVIVVRRDGEMPGRDELWKMMQAAVGGRLIVLNGYSGGKDEKTRVRYANARAANLRGRLIGIGFPSEIVMVNEKTEYKATGDKPRVDIVLTAKGGM